MVSGCNNCEYLSKRPGIGNYFIYKCSYWGLITQRVLPQSVIISSIGKRCPFFKQKIINSATKKDQKSSDSSKDGLDLIV
jgi:hypothetical protein